MAFGMVDLAVVVILFLSGLIAFYRGFVRESLGLGAWITATLAGLYGYGLLSPVFGEIFKSDMVSNIIAGVIIALAVLIVLTIIIGMITKSIRTSVLNGLDRLLGFIFGLLRGALIVVLLYVLGIVAFPLATVEWEGENTSVKYIKQSLSYAEEVLPTEVADNIKERIASAEKMYETKLAEEAKKRIEAAYKDADRKTLNDLFDSVVAEDGEAPSIDGSEATGTVIKHDPTEKLKQAK